MTAPVVPTGRLRDRTQPRLTADGLVLRPETAGYRFEGTQRRQGLHADGWHDMHLHARLRGDSDGCNE